MGFKNDLICLNKVLEKLSISRDFALAALDPKSIYKNNHPKIGNKYILLFEVKEDMYLPLIERVKLDMEIEMKSTTYNSLLGRGSHLGYQVNLNLYDISILKNDKHHPYGYKNLTPFLKRIGKYISGSKIVGEITRNDKVETTDYTLEDKFKTFILRDRDNNFFLFNRYGIFENNFKTPLIIPTIKVSTSPQIKKEEGIKVLINPILISGKKKGYKELLNYISSPEIYCSDFKSEEIEIIYMNKDFLNSYNVIPQKEYIKNMSNSFSNLDKVDIMEKLW